MGMGGQRHAPTALSPPPSGMTRYPFYGRLDGPQDWSGLVRKISPPQHHDSIPGPSIPQPVAIPTALSLLLERQVIKSMPTVIEQNAVSLRLAHISYYERKLRVRFSALWTAILKL